MAPPSPLRAPFPLVGGLVGVLCLGVLGLAGCRSDADSRALKTAGVSSEGGDTEGGDNIGDDGTDGGSGTGEDGGADGGDSGMDGGGEDGEDGSDGDDDPDITALVFGLDAPAFYDADRTVLLTGTAELEGGTLTEVEVAGEVVPVAAGRFSAEVALGEAPFLVVPVTARVGTESATLVAQVAEAEPVSAPVDDGMVSELDRDALDALGAHLVNHLDIADLAPTAGVELARQTCPGSPVPSLELTEYTEVVETTSSASLSLAVAVDPSSGALVLDLAGSTLTWPLERQITFEGGGFNTSLDATATLGVPASPAGSCTGAELAVQSDASDHAWTVDTSSLTCVTEVPTSELSTMYGDTVPAAVEQAACDWGAWLDVALGASVAGVTLDGTVTANADGVSRSWSLDSGAPWVVPGATAGGAGAGLAGSLSVPGAGLALDAAWRGALAAAGTVTVEEAGAELSLELVGAAESTGALAAVDDGARFLPAPVEVRLAVEGTPCATVHLVPEPVALDAELTALELGEAPGYAGLDALHSCPIAPERLVELAEEGLALAQGAVVGEWHIAEGLVDSGAVVRAELNDNDVHQTVEVPLP